MTSAAGRGPAPGQSDQLVHAIDRVPIHRDLAGAAGSARPGGEPVELRARQSLEPLDCRHHPSITSPRASVTLLGLPRTACCQSPGLAASGVEPQSHTICLIMLAGDAQQPPLSELMAIVPFAATLGIELVSATPEAVVGRLAWREELCTTGGAMHGGALMSLADNLGGVCAFLNLPAGATTATISSSTNFLRGIRAGHVTATARPLRVGRSVIVVQTELRDDAGQLAVQTTQAQAVIEP